MTDRPLRLFFRLICYVLVLAATVAAPCVEAADDYDSVRLFGVDYVDARDFARRFGLTPEWITARDTLRLKSRWTTIELTVRRVEAKLNGITLFLSEPVVARSGTLYLGRSDADRLFAPILAPHLGPPAGSLRTIVIDPGHGGRDPGNQNLRLKLKEKTFTLDVARRLRRLLVADGHRVVLTRTADRFISLDDRTALANRLKADLFVSIHFNAFSDSGVAGAETYVMTPYRVPSTPQRERDRDMLATRYPSNRNDHWNVVLGYQLHRALVERTGAADRGLKRFRYSVLRSVECPAVLVEAGFLSNLGEGRKAATSAYRQRIAEAIASGIKAHGKLRHRTEARVRKS